MRRLWLNSVCMSGSDVEHDDITVAYRALRATIKPIKAMREQWRGALLASAVLVPTMMALVTYAFFQEQDRVDRLEAEMRLLEPKLEAVRRDCAHVSPERMLKLDTTDNELEGKLLHVERDVKQIQKRLRIR